MFRVSRMLIAILLMPMLASGEVVQISTGEWSPLIDSKRANDGPLSMVIREAFALEGVAVEYVFVPWKRALHDLETGAVPLSAAWRKTDDRVKRFLFSSKPVYQGENVFFYNAALPFDWQRIEDLARYRLGGVRSYAYSTAFDAAARAGQLNVFRVNNESSLAAMLVAGRIDAFPADRQVGRSLLDALPPEQAAQIAIHPRPLTRKPLYLLGSQTARSQALLERFDRGLDALMKSGRVKQIYAQN